MPTTPDIQPSVDARQIKWRVEGASAGERLDRVIAAHIEEISRSFAATLIDQGAVLVSGSAALKASQRVKDGDEVSVHIPAPRPSSLLAEVIPLKIVYEDADLLVVDKPAGMVVHPAPGHSGGTLVNALLAHLPGLQFDMGDEARPGIVHRLDKDTSGLLVVAKRRAVHEALSKQMAAHTTRKEYLAVVAGKLHPEVGVIDAPIARDPRDRQRMAVVSSGRPARTHYRVERGLSRYTLIKAVLETGRTHQIRVHMASTGHPVLGDPVYGKRTLKDAASLDLRRQFLHAYRLGFTLPSSGEWREFTSPLPEELAMVLERIEQGQSQTGAM